MVPMKPLSLLSFGVVSCLLCACEVAALPPLVEVRDTRDTAADDTGSPDTESDSEDAAPETSEDTAADGAPDTTDASDPDTADPGDDTAEVADADLETTADADIEDDVATDVAEDADSVQVDAAGDTMPDAADTEDTADTADSDETSASCMPLIASHPIAASPHVTACSEVTYETDPPTSGPHYPVWAAFKTYGVPINPGFLVHALEHGAITLTWRCPSGCDAELAALQAMLDARAGDPLCDPLVKHRIIVAPRPDQDTKLVAAGWGVSWKADCFDLASLGSFIDAWYAKGPENVCAQGVDIETILPDNAWYCPP
jgi:hypothetical protein